MTSSAIDPSVIVLVEHGDISKYFTVAPFTMMVYDIFLTFPIEVEKIWKQRFSGLTLLWVLNRWVYLICAIFMVTEFVDPGWGPDLCSKTYKFPGLLDLGQRLVVGTIFALRIYCIYNRNVFVTLLVLLFILVELAFKIFVAAQLATPVIAPLGQGGCFESTSSQLTRQTLGFWITELTTDGAVLCLTAYRVYTAYWRHRYFVRGTLWRVIFMDGLMYFVVVFSGNLATVILYPIMPTELKPVAGPLGAYITSTLVSRLILNLKVAGSVEDTEVTTSSVLTTLGSNTRMEELIFGNMVNEMENSTGSEFSIDTYPTESYKLKHLRKI